MKVHLRKKKLKTGRQSLYLEFYKGIKTLSNGKVKHLRDYEYLQLYLIEGPKTTAEKKKNQEQLELAEQILAIRKAEVYQGKYNLKNDTKGKVSLLDFYVEKKEERYQSKGNYDNWDAAQKHQNPTAPLP